MLHVAQPHDAGVPRVASQLIVDQLGRGWPVAVASPPGGELQRFALRHGARWLPWPASREPGRSLAAEVRRLTAIVAVTDPRVVHLHSAKAGLAGRLAVHGRRPTIYQPHAWSFEAVDGVMASCSVRWERVAARWAQRVLCVSEDERRRGEDRGIAARWAVVPNGVDLAAHSHATPADRLAARHALGLGDAPLAVVVGRLCRQKGQDVLLDAWPRVLRRVPDAQLVLVGDGPDRAALAARGCPRVLFAGQCEDVPRWLAAATVVVLPSRWEGLSLSLLEALAAGRSVVATAVDGVRSVVGREAGAVVRVGDVVALAEEVARRLADPVFADAEGACGRHRVEQDHDVRFTTARVAELYDELLAAPSPRPDRKRLVGATC